MSAHSYTSSSGSSPSGRQGGLLKLKICGMKYADNIIEVATLSPDFMGFIFYPSSKRFVGEDFVMPEIPPKIKKVGVFVNETVENILEKVKKYKLDLVQLHGDESVEFCANASRVFKTFEVGRIQIIKVFGMDEQFNFSILKDYEPYCDYFLFDAKSTEYGGSGNSFDRHLLSNYTSSQPFFISGGIGLGSIPMPYTLYPIPFSIDVNSKFEIKPGLKDINKLKLLQHELSGRR